MHHSLVGTALAAALALNAVPLQADPGRTLSSGLQAALPLPRVSLAHRTAMSLGIDFSPDRGFSMAMGVETAEAKPRAAALRRSLRHFPRDAAGYERLANYEAFLGDRAGAARDDGEAATLYGLLAADRKQSRQDRETALAGRCRVLERTGATVQAEGILRKALRERPRSWRLWDALGQLQEGEARQTLTRAGTAAALRLDRAAHADFDRAVSLAPQQGMAFAARGDFLGFLHPDFLDAVARRKGVKAPPFQTTVVPEALADFRRAAHLLPDDPYAVSYPVWLEVSTLGFFHLHRPFPSQAAWQAMPTGTRRFATDTIRHLTRLSRIRGTRGRCADVPLGFLLYETRRKTAAAEAALRSGLSGPDHEQAAEMLMHVMGLEREDQALAAFCKREAHRHDTPRLHLIGALAEADQARWVQAQVETRRALSLEPNDPTDLLLQAVLTLKRDISATGLAEADNLLERAARASHAGPSSAPDPAEVRVTHAYFLALGGNADAAVAEFRAVISIQPHIPGAAQGLALLLDTHMNETMSSTAATKGSLLCPNKKERPKASQNQAGTQQAARSTREHG